mmetsp:Transcript_29458/g.79533  ORF Transcript_29458/g.79533 Transcript_29458/m.79533 type:complete len:221 (-) Transcript_29458:193-855(-)
MACAPLASKERCCSAILARSSASASRCKRSAAALARSERASSCPVPTSSRWRAACSCCSLSASAAEASWDSAASVAAVIQRRCTAPCCSSKLRTSAMCRSWFARRSATASEVQFSLRCRRSCAAESSASSPALPCCIESFSRCRSSICLRTMACITGEISHSTSRLIWALFLTNLARLPNSKEHLVSSRSALCAEHVMMRQVLELPPKLSAKSLVSMESL